MSLVSREVGGNERWSDERGHDWWRDNAGHNGRFSCCNVEWPMGMRESAHSAGRCRQAAARMCLCFRMCGRQRAGCSERGCWSSAWCYRGRRTGSGPQSRKAGRRFRNSEDTDEVGASECKAGNESEADQRGGGGVEVVEGNERRASLFIVSAAAHAPQCKIFLSKRIGGQVGCAGGGEDEVSCK